MFHHNKKSRILFFLLSIPFFLTGQSIKIVTNHVGYEKNKAKRAVIISENPASINAFQLVNVSDNSEVYTGKATFSGPVDKWKNWLFWTLDFSDYRTPGTYRLEISSSGKTI